MRTKAKYTKADYLTIPDAPNYEINGYFKVRNKKTGKFLKTRKQVGKNCRCVMVRGKNSKNIQSTVNAFYRKALAETLKNEDRWTPIFFTGNLYEMHPNGKVRNAKTKRLLKPDKRSGDFYYFLRYNGKINVIPLRKLFNECFGEIFPRKRGIVNVILSKDGKNFCFKTIKEATKFLSKKVFYCSEYLSQLMNKRQPEIYGYAVRYIQKASFKVEKNVSA